VETVLIDDGLEARVLGAAGHLGAEPRGLLLDGELVGLVGGVVEYGEGKEGPVDVSERVAAEGARVALGLGWGRGRGGKGRIGGLARTHVEL
jgi:hypothetical protein